jgi:alpha-tubulin suppressor-like RCC1 family protein
MPCRVPSTLRRALAAVLAAAALGCSDSRTPTEPSLAKGGNAAPLTVTPTSVVLSPVTGTPATLTAKVQFVGVITAVSSDVGCATVAPSSVPATKPPGSPAYVATFTVTPVASGTCTITLTDKKGGQVQAQVVVTAVELRGASLVSGRGYSCGLTPAGAAYCWGWNAFGQLGATINAQYTTTPVAVSGGLTFASLAAGRAHVCGLTRSGAAYCWGSNFDGELGNTSVSGTTTTPTAVIGGHTFYQLAASGFHTCGLTATGAAYCWGSNNHGQLGTATNAGTDNANPTPSAVGGDLSFVALTAGFDHTCGRTQDDAAYCWGNNNGGELGNGTTGTDPVTSPEAVAGSLAFTQLGAGDRFTCGLTEAGAAYCWGFNFNGVLGSTVPGNIASSPAAVSGGLSFAALASGLDHNCALTAAGAAYCWGRNPSGDLGVTPSGPTDSRDAPVAVGGGLSFALLGLGDDASCGITGAGQAYCWGRNDVGQLGSDANVGTQNDNPSPVAVSGGLTFGVP